MELILIAYKERDEEFEQDLAAFIQARGGLTFWSQETVKFDDIEYAARSNMIGLVNSMGRFASRLEIPEPRPMKKV